MFYDLNLQVYSHTLGRHISSQHVSKVVNYDRKLRIRFVTRVVRMLLKMFYFHFCDFPTFTNSTNLQIIYK